MYSNNRVSPKGGGGDVSIRFPAEFSTHSSYSMSANRNNGIAGHPRSNGPNPYSNTDPTRFRHATGHINRDNIEGKGIGQTLSESFSATMTRYNAFNWLRILFLETLATWIFLSIILATASAATDPLSMPFVHGFGIFFIFSLFINEDAGYTNPFIVIILALLGKLPGPRWSFIIYILAEMIGTILAVLLIWLLTPNFDRSFGLGTPGLQTGFTSGQGFVAEFFGSAVFYSIIVWTLCLRKYYMERLKEKGTALPEYIAANPALVIGLGFTAITIPLVFITGASFNWFRHFWPALISGTLDKTWWIYFVGPITGTFVAWLIMWGYLRWIDYNNTLSKSSNQIPTSSNMMNQFPPNNNQYPPQQQQRRPVRGGGGGGGYSNV